MCKLNSLLLKWSQFKYNVKDIALSLIVAISFYLILFNNPYIDSFFKVYQYKYYYNVALLITLILVGFKRCFRRNSSRLALTSIDITAIIFLLSTFASRVINGKTIGNDISLNLLSLGAFYVLISRGASIKCLRLLQLSLIVSLTFEVFLVYKQIFNIVKLDFWVDREPISGSLENSGMLAALFVSFFPLYKVSSEVQKSIYSKLWTITTVVNTIILVIVTEARGPLIACIYLFISFLLENYRTTFSEWRKTVFYKKQLHILLGLIIFSLLVLFKFDSSIGRLFIWAISLSKFVEHPIFGIGFGEFSSTYNLWQASFFKKGGDTTFSILADSTYTCFNEYLQILIEGGIFVFSSFCLLVSQLLRPKILDQNSVKVYRQVIIVILIMSGVSYPLHSTPVLFLFVLSMAMVSRQSYISVEFSIPAHLRYLLYGIGLSACLALTAYFFDQTRLIMSEPRLMQNISEIRKGEWVSSPLRIVNNSPYLLTNVASECALHGSREVAIEILEDGKARFCNYDILMSLGELYTVEGDLKQAEANFRLAAYMIPVRFLPHQSLFELYLFKQDSIAANEEAKIIVNMPVKIESSEIERIKLEAALFIKNSEKRY